MSNPSMCYDTVRCFGLWQDKKIIILNILPELKCNKFIYKLVCKNKIIQVLIALYLGTNSVATLPQLCNAVKLWQTASKRPFLSMCSNKILSINFFLCILFARQYELNMVDKGSIPCEREMVEFLSKIISPFQVFGSSGLKSLVKTRKLRNRLFSKIPIKLVARASFSSAGTL